MKGVSDALRRLSGVQNVTVKLQEGLVVAKTDPAQTVLPSALWAEIARVGFKPAGMDLRARGTFDGNAFVVDGKRWPLAGPKPEDKRPRVAHLKVRDGGQDPPHVEALE